MLFIGTAHGTQISVSLGSNLDLTIANITAPVTVWEVLPGEDKDDSSIAFTLADSKRGKIKSPLFWIN